MKESIKPGSILASEWLDSSILFIDIVEFSTLIEPKQSDVYSLLWQAASEKIKKYSPLVDYLIKSTGDGLLMIAFNPKMDLLTIAMNIQNKLKPKNIHVRQGLNCGKVLQTLDKTDAIGDPINMCQRVMDCGDEDHILATEYFMAVKVGSRPPRENYHDIGIYTVKHEKQLKLFNYFDEKVGNPNLPSNIALLLPDLKNFCTSGNWSSLLNSCDIIDLSHSLRNEPPCTFSTQEYTGIHVEIDRGQGIGVSFITSVLNNLFLNYGTHIDFPGHLSFDHKAPTNIKVGDYPLSSFVTDTVVIDVRSKLDVIRGYYDKNGRIDLSSLGTGRQLIDKFFGILEQMAISLDEFIAQVPPTVSLEKKAVLFCTGLDALWQFKSSEPWQYSYYFNPFISPELATYLIERKVSLVGIDALQVENPLINFCGKEPHQMAWDGYEAFIEEQLKSLYKNLIHKLFLENNIMIIENLKNLNSLIGKSSLLCAAPLKLLASGCTDNSITRAFAVILK